MGENHPFPCSDSTGEFWLQNQIHNVIFHSYYFGQSFWNVNNKKLSSFAQWTKKLPGIGYHGEERKLNKENCQKLSKILWRIHRQKYLGYFLLFVFSIELCAWGKLFFGTRGSSIKSFIPNISMVWTTASGRLSSCSISQRYIPPSWTPTLDIWRSVFANFILGSRLTFIVPAVRTRWPFFHSIMLPGRSVSCVTGQSRSRVDPTSIWKQTVITNDVKNYYKWVF